MCMIWVLPCLKCRFIAFCKTSFFLGDGLFFVIFAREKNREYKSLQIYNTWNFPYRTTSKNMRMANFTRHENMWFTFIDLI